MDIDGDAIFNESGAAKYFRIELDANTHQFFVDGTNNEIGINTASPVSSLDIQGSLGLGVTAITSATTLDQTHNVVLCSGGAFTVTLPAAATNSGKTYYIKKTDGGTNYITIDGNASETIDGDNEVVLYVQYDAIRIVCDGSNWHIVDDEITPHSAKLVRSTAQAVANSTLTKIEFNTASIDVGNITDVTTDYAIEIRRSGTYLLTSNVMLSGMDDQEKVESVIQVDGTTVKYDILWMSATSDSYGTARIIAYLDLTAGEKVTFSVSHN